MRSGTIFLAGVYGVGKSTICQNLSNMYNLSVHSASDLISNINEEIYGKSKLVSDLDNNQFILCKQVESILAIEPMIILAGHFCILGKDFEIISIPDKTYENLRILRIILLEADINTIQSNLCTRDELCYPPNTISALSIAERAKAFSVAGKLNVPLLVHQMKYSEWDTQELYKFLNQ